MSRRPVTVSPLPPWMARIVVEVDPAELSDNKRYACRTKKALADRQRRLRDAISALVVEKTRGCAVTKSRTWLAIHVAKKDHRSDAINVLKCVADAVKRAIDVDDRWYEVRNLSWEIDAARPRVEIEVGQDGRRPIGFLGDQHARGLGVE